MPATALVLGIALAATALAGATPAAAQNSGVVGSTNSGTFGAQPSGAFGANVLNARKLDPNQKMLVTADQLEYDYQKDTVAAVGTVQIYYDGSTLEANRVVLDRKANTMFAQGNVRLKDKDGKIVTAETLQLTQDFKQGFIDSLRLDTPDKTHFSAARADRTEGNVTVFQNGTYTACEPCKDDPSKPPLWQIKAKKIIHNEDQQMIYYQDAWVEFFGMPVAYFPYLSSPDPTVKRKTGFLMPEFFSSTQIGQAVALPFFWNIAPDRDLTLTPGFVTQQGLLMQGEWRQRLANGSYTISAAGISQENKQDFITTSNGVTEVLPGYRDNRGAIQSTGAFALNQFWTFGWDATVASDRTFLRDYNLIGDTVTTKTSTAYLTGQGDRSYFDVRGLYFLGLAVTDDQDRQPVVGTLNYNKVFEKSFWGGETTFKTNFTSLTRQEADFIGMSAVDSSIGAVGIPTGACTIANPTSRECLLRGAPGDYTRLSADLSWRKTITDSLGQQWTPFASARVDVASVNVSQLPFNYAYGPTFPGQNPLQPGSDDLIRAMPAVGLDYKYPFISAESWGTQTIEPRAQVIIRPNEADIGKFPNEDAQSLVFDDTNLFEMNKYSGYDRVEGGSRLNLGVTYSAAINGAGLFTAVVGQSYNLFGKNSYAYGDMANTGLESGLETSASDYIAKFGYSPTKNLEIVTRFRFDESSFSMQRFELQGRAEIDRFNVAVTYGRYEPQPLLGFYDTREGIYTNASYKFNDNWAVRGAVRYDFAGGEVDYTLLGLSYIDDCFTLALNYISDYTLNGPSAPPVSKVMFRIGLRTLGEGGFSTSFGSENSQ
ncbi:LPS-assembly protein LptD [Xanthobacter dioxanivorans]|uniref:LPS-assembly protein LptD n=1 Tax=Xanthobacter dioxanivorans TaxID=2528964 RepID=A0A974SKJ0_9HYPH|nr:LPS-assembly protein LptD [Xanthobacter dioxanivorans]QRG08890.1 LPS-assembly protein LptD [Xanthobacter dioxanivorans]